MHRLATSFVLGYHGCDAKIAEALLGGESFKPSQNDYDWLGPGVYFWEANPLRAVEFAREAARRKGAPPIDEPAVVGAVVELGLCLDLTTSEGVSQAIEAHRRLLETVDKVGYELPTNSPDLLRRNLDCAVVRMFHDIRKEKGLDPADTVRGLFQEGEPIYENSGFYAKTHVQICVCNPDCIKGVFRIPANRIE